jgi:hypothetical protein
LSENGGIVRIHIFWDDELSPENQDYHNYQLEDALTNDMLEHSWRDNVLIS